MITKIVEYIKAFLSKKPIAKEETMAEYKDMVCGISYAYHQNKTISIDIVLNKIDDDDQIKQSEIFAQFLYHISQPSFRQTVLDNMKHHSESPDDVLFYQNVVFNIAMLELYHNNKEHSKKKDQEPVIRPLSVFNVAN